MSEQPDTIQETPAPGISGVVMDVFRLSVLEWYEHQGDINNPALSQADKLTRWSQTLAKVIVRAPKAWGDPANPALYLNPALVNFVIFGELITLFYTQVEAEQKKVRTKSTTP